MRRFTDLPRLQRQSLLHSSMTWPRSLAFSVHRAVQAAVAAWLEEQSGLSLLTPEGKSAAYSFGCAYRTFRPNLGQQLQLDLSTLITRCWHARTSAGWWTAASYLLTGCTH